MFAEIRLASIADISSILEIEAASFRCPWDSRTIAGLLASPSCRTWTAVENGITEGYATACLDGSALHVVNMAVHPEHRRKGLAIALLATAESWGERLGAAVSRLEVRRGARAARALYSRRGYRARRSIPEYYPDGEDALELHRRMDPCSVTASAAVVLLSMLTRIPKVGIVLGSGLSWLAEESGGGRQIAYSEVMEGDDPEVPGHPGRLVLSRCGRYVFLLGRRHHYQGFSGDETALLPGVLADLGVRTWILTTSSGAVDGELAAGDAVLFSDHVNFTGCVPSNPAGRIGSPVYSERLREAAERAAGSTGANLVSGVFACVSGPAYETSAEIAFLKAAGISTVSMSTVPEALLLSSRGHEVAAVSLVTNASSPGTVLTHEEVLSSQSEIRRRQSRFLRAFLREAVPDELL